MACGCQVPVTRHVNLLADAPSSGNHLCPAGHLVPPRPMRECPTYARTGRARHVFRPLSSPYQSARLIELSGTVVIPSRERQPVGLTECCERVEGVEEQSNKECGSRTGGTGQAPCRRSRRLRGRAHGGGPVLIQFPQATRDRRADSVSPRCRSRACCAAASGSTTSSPPATPERRPSDE